MTSDDMVTRPSSEKELNLKGLIGSANGSRTRLLGYRTVTSRSKLLTRKGRYGRAVHAVSGSFAGMFARCLHGRPSLPLRRGLLGVQLQCRVKKELDCFGPSREHPLEAVLVDSRHQLGRNVHVEWGLAFCWHVDRIYHLFGVDK